MITLIDTLIPLVAVAIVFATPKGCNKTINTILACMLIFIYGLEEFSLEIIDGAWYDATLSCLYIAMAALFYRVGGNIQSALTSVGAILHIGYGMLWSIEALPLDSFYSEAFISLTLMQLLAASNGVFTPILKRLLNGGGDGCGNFRSNNHGSRGGSGHRNHP